MSSHQVTKVRVVCHDLRPNLNHWSIFLLLQDGESSIQLDTVSAPGKKGKKVLSVKTCKYRLPHSALKHWDFPVDPFELAGRNIPFRIFQREVYMQGRDYYRTADGSGEGCRWWVWNVMYDFCIKGLIGLDSYEKIKAKIKYVYSSDGSKELRKIARGQFPDRDHLRGVLIRTKQQELSDEDSDGGVFSDGHDD
ncbi:hypothetical protein TWF506_003642 [Arthrobotrys conoides]|uniref:DUF7770 domain-containing protein n=1 Tax=Arthrobotrys conoides TaxID=74498 RepID=A0AAN8N7P3_9PEZI